MSCLKIQMKDKERTDQNLILKGYNMLLYFTGSMIMFEPSEECVTDFFSGELLRTLPVRSRNPRFIEAASMLRNSCTDKNSCREMLQQDFNTLFSGSLLAPPLKSVYFSNDIYPGKETISDFYDSYGWKDRSRYSFPDDNLGVELLFLTLLTDKYITIDDHVSRAELGNEIRRFIEKHILSWISDWCNMVQEKARTLCYKGIAKLIHACVEDVHTIVRPSAETPAPFADLRN